MSYITLFPLEPRRSENGTTKVGDLTERKLIPPGTTHKAMVTHVDEPHQFFIVLEEKDIYMLDHPEWTRFFAAWNSGTQALRELTKLLVLYYNLSFSLCRRFGKYRKEVFRSGDLVAVKMKVMNGRSQNELQIRRGLVVTTFEDNACMMHEVYLIDFGGHVSVPCKCLLPLPKPFNFIPPLAIKAGLFGVSPIGEIWDRPGKDVFKKSVVCHQIQKSSFCVEVMPRIVATEVFPIYTTVLVSMDAHNRVDKHSIRFTEDLHFLEQLVKKSHGLSWNLFPARPMLMERTLLFQNFQETNVISESCAIENIHIKISMSEGMFLMPFHLREYSHLPMEVQKRDVKRLFQLRKNVLVDVMGMDNRLLGVMKETNPKLLNVYQTPCKVIGSSDE